MAMLFNNCLHFSDLWVWFFVKIHLLVNIFWHFHIYGYDFQKIFRIYGWYFYDLNGTTPYLGNPSDPLPRECMSLWSLDILQKYTKKQCMDRCILKK